MRHTKTFGQLLAVFLVIIVVILVLSGPAERPTAETGLEGIEQVLRATQEQLQ